MTRIADPFAPRARIQARSRQAGNLEREEVVASGDSRAAHRHKLVCRARSKHRLPATAQLRHRQKATLCVKIGHEGCIYGAGNVSGDGVDLLILAGEAIGTARVDEENLFLRERALDLLGVERAERTSSAVLIGSPPASHAA